MTDDLLPDDDGEAVVASLSGKLAAYAESLDGRQRRMLERLLYRAMDPIERAVLAAPEDLLDARELEILSGIEKKGD